MLGVGWSEMLVIGVVALIVIGPKELPSLMQKLGRFAGQVRRMGSDFQRELNKTTGLDEVKNLRTAITQPLKATTDAIRKEFNTTTASGAVQPSGALKPADPKVESVVSEIHKAAGMPAPAEPAKAVEVAAAAAAASPVKAAGAGPALAIPAADKPAATTKRVARAKAAPTSEVTTADLFPPEKPKPARKPRHPKAVESPAPIEAIAPEDKPKRVRKPAAKKAAAKKTAAKSAPADDKPAGPPAGADVPPADEQA